jgi:carboxylesterase type B
MAIVLVAGILGDLLSASPLARSPSSPLARSAIVELGYSRYQGVALSNGVDEYMGMRYAKPPLNELRFRGPEDPEQTDGVVDATAVSSCRTALIVQKLHRTSKTDKPQFGPVCVGVGQRTSQSLGEDCLFVNVWRPSNATTDSNLPVWLFIQGGGYADNANFNFNGSEVVKQSGYDIIFVNFNYRVGALGFLASEDIRKDGDLNAGLLDQRKVLEWVQQHIRQFGGNPNHVVIHGDSAGAGSVAHHLTAYGGRDMNLFVGAVAESTFWPTQRTVAETEFQYERFAQDVGCGGVDNTLACLRSVDITTIINYDVDKPFPGGSDSPTPLWYFLPVVDGTLITDRLYNLFLQNKFIHVPLMVTDDTNEGTPFGYNASSPEEVAQFMKNNYPGLSDEELKEINEAYPLTDPLPKHAAYFPSAAQAYGESTFTCPGNHMASMMARYFSSYKVWNYRFNVHDPAETANGMGVPHVFELPAIFGLGDTNQASESFANVNAKIVPITMNYYLSFIKTLDPNVYKYEEAPVWKTWGIGYGQRLKIQTGSTEMEPVPQDQLDRCTRWRGLSKSMEH